MNESQWLASTEPAAMLRVATGQEPCQTDHQGIAPHFYHKASDRKLRLWCCAVARQAWPMLTNERSRRAVEVAERFADGEATEEELETANKRADGAIHPVDWNALDLPVPASEPKVERLVMDMVYILRRIDLVRPTVQASLLRCMMGNPFRPVRLPRPEVEAPCPWLTDTVLSLAQAAYDVRPIWKCQRCWGTGDRNPGQSAHHYDRPKKSDDCPDCNGSGRIQDGTLDPERLAVLSDALEEAGCTEQSILQHLRGWEWYQMKGGGNVKREIAHVRGCWAVDLLLGKE